MPTAAERHGSPRGERPSRGTANQRGYTYQWQVYSKRFLFEHPLCEECKRHGRVAAAKVVDHVKPHRGDQVLFWDASNHQSMCLSCHGIKSAKERIG